MSSFKLVKDSVSGSINDKITSGGILEIDGSLLKVEGTDASNGVFFVATDGTKNKVVTLAENKPAKLIVMIPTLTAGTYKLQITTQYSGGGKYLKSPRTGIFKRQLTVA